MTKPIKPVSMPIPRAKTTIEPVKSAQVRSTMPHRPVIEHTKLFRAALQIEHEKANGRLAEADLALANAAAERDAQIEFANEQFTAVRRELDRERSDILVHLTGIEAGLTAMQPKTVEGVLGDEVKE